MSQTFQLFRLQQIDSQMDQIQARLKEIAAALSEDEALNQAQRKLDQTTQALQANQKALRRAEDDVKQQRIKIEQTDASLYGGKIRVPKELQDLQNEAAALRRHLSVLEDRQLEAMLGVEESEAAQQQAQSELEQVTGQFNQQHASLNEEQTRLQKDLARLEGERSAVANPIPETDRALYEKLRGQRRGIAVSKVKDKACSACGSMLSAALLSAARSPSQLTRCEMCGRILYAG